MIRADVTPIKSDPRNKKRTLDLEFTAAPVRDLLRLIGDVGGVNVIVAPGELPALTVRTKRLPWDLLLDVLVARAGLTAFREGNAIYVVPAGTNVEVSKATSKDLLLDLELNDATLAEAVTAIRTVTPLELGNCSTTTKLTFRVRRMPRSRVVKALEIASGEKFTDKNPCPTAKAITNEPLGELTLTAIASYPARRGAVFAHKGGILYGTRNQPARLKDIGANFVSFDTGEDLNLRAPGSGDGQPRQVPEFVRTAALIKRGEHWHALMETTTGALHRISSGERLSETVTAEVVGDGVNLSGNGPSSRSIPLAPK